MRLMDRTKIRPIDQVGGCLVNTQYQLPYFNDLILGIVLCIFLNPKTACRRLLSIFLVYQCLHAVQDKTP